MANLGLAQAILFSEDFSSSNDKTPPSGWAFKLLQGITANDSFQFENSSFILTSPFKNKFASFDVYEGGYQRGSNGDNSIEDAVLISPTIRIDSTEIGVSFDYYFNKLRSPKFSLEITEDTGKSWRQIWIDSVGNKSIEKGHTTVNTQNSNTRAVQFRFRWKTSNSQLTQGYVVFDNMLVFNILSKDIGINTDLSKTELVYKGDNLNIQYKISNHGRSSISGIKIKTLLVNPSNDIILEKTDTIDQLLSNATTNQEISLSKFQDIGAYKLIIRNLEWDYSLHNDSVLVSILVFDSIQKPKGQNAARCGAGSLELKATASSGDSILWSNVYSNDILHAGTAFQTPELNSTENFRAQVSNNFPRELHTGQGPFRFKGIVGGGSYFSVKAKRPITIKNLSQHFANADIAKISVYIKKGTYKGYERTASDWLKIFSDSIETKAWGTWTEINIPAQYLLKGDTMSFYIQCEGSSLYTFKRVKYETSNSDLSFSSDAVNSRAFSNSGGLFTPYSWDGKINYDYMMMSDYTSVEAKIVKRPHGSGFKVDKSYRGVPQSGTNARPDHLSDQGYGAYKVKAPNLLLNTDYKKTWEVEKLTIKTRGGLQVPNTYYWMVAPNGTKDLQVGFTPKGQWIDSTLVLTLSVKDLVSMCDTIIRRVIHVSELPKPRFVNDVNCSDYPIAFYNNSKDIDSLTHFWEMGDGSSEQGQNVVHRYQSAGTYLVRLTAFNKYGISASYEDTISIYKRPTAIANITHACLGESVRVFIDDGNNGPETIYSLIKDAKILADSLQAGFHNLSLSEGKNTLSLIAQNEACSDTGRYQAFQFPIPKADFSIEGSCQFDNFQFKNHSSILNGEKIGYQWRSEGKIFETSKSFDQKINTSGRQDYELIAISQFNCRDTIVKQIDIKASPKARFKASLACDNEPTQFFNLSKIPDGFIYIYNWEFGDGQNSSDSVPIHFYQVLGEQAVSLNIQSSNGCTSSYDSSLIVRVQPDAKFSVNDVCTGKEAVFVNSSRIENKILQYKWLFGDGDSSDMHSPRHLFPARATESYRVILEVFVEDNSCRDEHSELVIVHKSPRCEFEHTILGDPLHIGFQVIDTQLTELTWSFEGGGFDTVQRPKYLFQVPGSYLVRLFAKNSVGCDCRFEKYINVGNVGMNDIDQNFWTIYPNPVQNILYLDNNLEENISIKLTDHCGKTLINRHFNQYRLMIVMSQYSAGVYNLEVRSSRGMSVRRIVKI